MDYDKEMQLIRARVDSVLLEHAQSVILLVGLVAIGLAVSGIVAMAIYAAYHGG